MKKWIGDRLILLSGWLLKKGLAARGWTHVSVNIEGRLEAPDTRSVETWVKPIAYLADNGARVRLFQTADEARDWLIETNAEPNTGVAVARFIGGEEDETCYPTFPIDPKGPLFPLEASAE